MKTERRMLQAGSVFQAGKQVKTELIQPQIHDGNARVHILHVHHLALQTFQLLAPIFKVAFLFRRYGIVIARTCQHRHLHAGFHPSFQVNVFVKSHVRPVVHKLNHLVARADAVDTPETLNDAHGIPMDVVIDETVTILQVLSLADAVGSDKHVYLLPDVRINGRLLL